MWNFKNTIFGSAAKFDLVEHLVAYNSIDSLIEFPVTWDSLHKVQASILHTAGTFFTNYQYITFLLLTTYL